MNAAQDLYALICTMASGAFGTISFTALATSTVLRSTVPSATGAMFSCLSARVTPSRPALPYESF